MAIRRIRVLSRGVPVFAILLLSGPLFAGRTTGPQPQRDESQQNQPRKFTLGEPAPAEPVLLPPPPVLQWNPFGTRELRPSLFDQREALLGRSRDLIPPPPGSVTRAILGFVALLVLAYLGGHRSVQRFEQRFNIAHLATAGLPFLFLGLIAAQPGIGILSPEVLKEIAPLLSLGLGWIGFAVGSRFNARALDDLPPGTSAAVFLTTAFPIFAIFVVCAVVLAASGQSVAESGYLRDALLLGTAGAMAARKSPRFARKMFPAERPIGRLARIVELQQLAGVFGLMMVSAYFRPHGPAVAWQLPGTAWLFIMLGIGTTMGVLVYATLTKINKDPQFTVALLGAIAFTAGIASFLRLSPVAVCFIAGAIIVNLGGTWKEQVRTVLRHLERPVYFVFLVIAGALWHPSEWQGWALMVIFVTVRFASKWLSVELLRRFWVHDLAFRERRSLTASPVGALSIAIVVSAQDLYSGPSVPWIVTAVIGGAVVMEAALQLSVRRMGPAKKPAPAALET